MLNDSSTFNSKMSSNSTESKESPNAAIDFVKLMFFLLIMLATLIGNSLVCMAVASFRNLRTHTNLVLVSLAATDLFMVFVMALNATTAVTTEWSFGEEWCDIIASAGLTIAFISILHLCFLSVDRFIAIHSPFQYPFLVTKRRVSSILPLLWIFPIVALHLPIADISFRGQVYGCSIRAYTPTHSQMFYTFIMVAVFVAVPFTIMLITHAYVFTVAFRHARRLGLMERSVRAISKDNHSDNSSSRKSISKSISKSLEFNNLRREIKSAKTFALIVGAFLLCYLPFFTAGTYRKYSGADSISHNTMLIMTWIAFSNSFCNPLLYGVRYTQFRKAFKRLCCRCCTDDGVLRMSTLGESFTMTQVKSLGDGSVLRLQTAKKENKTRAGDLQSGTEAPNQQIPDTNSVARAETETRVIDVESKRDSSSIWFVCKEGKR